LSIKTFEGSHNKKFPIVFASKHYQVVKVPWSWSLS